MARSFKQLIGDDIKNTRTLLHEAIPVTGTIVSGTYKDRNIKTFSHGMFESVYDYPYLSSSANHIFDVTYGHSSHISSSAITQNAKKLNIYNSMAQVLVGYDTGSHIRKFDSDGTHDDSVGVMNHCFFLNFSRLLTKDEIKKNSFRLGMHCSGNVQNDGTHRRSLKTIGDYAAGTQFRSSPAGDYGLLFENSGDSSYPSRSIGLVFYQAGVAVITSSIFREEFGINQDNHDESVPAYSEDGSSAVVGVGGYAGKNDGVTAAQSSSAIQHLAGGFRHMFHNLDFNNTIELNSTIYFCRINHNEFNYSSNPTFVSGSRLVVKNNVNDLPVTYITTIGLYSPDNELMAVAKLSEPIRKDPNTELTLRVRLDY